MYRFTGVYSVKMDSQRRVVLPSELRNGGGLNEVILTENPVGRYFLSRNVMYLRERDGEVHRVSVYPREAFEGIVPDFDTQSLMGVMTKGVNIDGQGRITVPEPFMEYASLLTDTEVVVSGALDRVEIWNPEIYENFRKHPAF